MSEPLFPYQRIGAEWLAARKYGYLADQMRLGKCAQTITALDLAGADTALVLCPAVARVNWAREFAKFSARPRRVMPLLARADASKTDDADIVVSSYEMAGDLPPRKWDVLVPDEAHYLKSLDAERTAAVLGARGLIHTADRAWFLSGTPAPNNPAELWPVLYVIGATRLTYEQFVARYCTTRRTPYGVVVTGGKNLDELREAMGPYLLRRLKAQVRPDMPQILLSHVTVQPGPVDLELHFFTQWRAGEDRLKQQIARELAAIEGAFTGDLAVLEAIMDSTPVARRYVGLQKVEPVAEMVKAELTSDRTAKIVLFAWHREVIEGLRRRLTEFNPVTLYGGTPATEKQKRIDRFNHNHACRVFIGNLIAAGSAIPLTGAHNGLIVEPSWVPGENAQAAHRMDGPEQKAQITVQFVSIAGHVDEAIQQANVRKTRTLSNLFD